MPKTLCRIHPLTDDHVAALVRILDEKLEAARADRNVSHDALSELFELRGVVVGMQRKQEKPRRARATRGSRAGGSQAALPTITPTDATTSSDDTPQRLEPAEVVA